VTFFNLWIIGAIIMFAIGLHLVLNDDFQYFGMMMPGAMFSIYGIIIYLVLFICPFCCETNVRTSRRNQCCQHLLYTPIEPITAAVDGGTATALTTYVDQLEAAQPQLFFRVEGHLNQRERDAAYNLTGTAAGRGANQVAMYGFTHHFPTTVSSAVNASASTEAVGKWGSRSSDYGVVRFHYRLTLSEDDQRWARDTCRALETAYRGHEGCHEVRATLVYALPSITSAATSMSLYTPYDATKGYDPTFRAGANANLYIWSETATLEKVGDAPFTGVTIPSTINSCLSGLFKRSCACFALLTCMYVPLICFLRGCVVKEADFTHVKQVTLGRAVVTGERGQTVEVVDGIAVAGA
jgi:hypothetical protein